MISFIMIKIQIGKCVLFERPIIVSTTLTRIYNIYHIDIHICIV
jgi:hypothetical protein